MANTESLTLKWGTLKAWSLKTEKSLEIMQRYLDLGSSMSAMCQHDTPDQQVLICELIDAIDADTIYLSWEGKDVSKEEAKKYVLNYRK